MALETGTYISDLVVTNPTSSDPKSQGDDHIRLVKSTVKTTFPNVTGAISASHTEVNYSVGVTSAIQTQINTKGAITGQTWTGTHDYSAATAVSLPANTSIGSVSATEISYVDGVTSAIQTQINTKGAITGQAWTGTHNFTGATVVTLPPTGTGTTEAVRKDYADGLAFAAALPAQAGNAGKYVTTNGTTASWVAINGTVPIGSLIAYYNAGTTFTDSGATYLRTGVIALSSTYPTVPAGATKNISNGTTWVARTLPSALTWKAVAYGNGIFVATPSETVSTAYATSPDGITWTARSYPSTGTWSIATFGAGLFVVVNVDVASTAILTSPDGITWTARSSVAHANSWASCSYGDSGFVLIENSTTASFSADGITWSANTLAVSPGGANAQLVFGNGYYVIASATVQQRSGNGITWTQVPATAGTIGSPSAFGNGIFVFGSGGGNIWTSVDGTAYTKRPVSSTLGAVSVTFGNGVFVATGATATATAFTSNDGITWTSRALPSSLNWSCTGFGSDAFVALSPVSTSAASSVNVGTYTDTVKALFADFPTNSRPLYMRVA